MAMGRPPKPTELKRALGNPGKRPLPTPLASLPGASGIPDPPRGLRKPGKTAWLRLWRVGSAWLSPTTDLDLLVRLCQAHDERDTLRGLVRKHGHLIESERNGLVANPAVSQLRKLEELITRYEGLCGFSPSDRSRLGMAEVQRESKLDQLISSRNQRAADAGE